jgi:hypothetical protein
MSDGPTLDGIKDGRLILWRDSGDSRLPGTVTPGTTLHISPEGSLSPPCTICGTDRCSDATPDLHNLRSWLKLQSAETIGNVMETCCEVLRQRYDTREGQR